MNSFFKCFFSLSRLQPPYFFSIFILIWFCLLDEYEVIHVQHNLTNVHAFSYLTEFRKILISDYSSALSSFRRQLDKLWCIIDEEERAKRINDYKFIHPVNRFCNTIVWKNHKIYKNNYWMNRRDMVCAMLVPSSMKKKVKRSQCRL